MFHRILKRYKKNRGSTIIELLIAVMVVGLIVTAVANAVTTSIKNTGESRFRDNATVLGQQVLEYMRGQKNQLGMPAFIAAFSEPTYCFVANVESPINTECGTSDTIVLSGTEFTREARIGSGGAGTRANPYYMTVTVTVSWLDGTQTRQVELIQEFQQDAGFTN